MTKFGTRTQILTLSTEMWEKFRNSQIQDGGRTPYWKSFFGYNSAPYCPIKTKFGVRMHNRTRTKVCWWKCQISQNPTWRTAAILKIVIAPYLSRKLSEFDEIWYADANIEQGDGNVTKIPVIPKFKMADGRHIENHFVAITRLHIVRLRRNLEFSIIARKRRLGAKNVKFRKSNIGDGRHFENHYISISQPQIVRISRNLVCRHKFLSQATETWQKIRNSQIQNGGWTPHWKSLFWL